MKYNFFIILVLLIYAGNSFSQNIGLSFPALPNKEVKAYFYKASKPDSLIIRLDAQGKGSADFPANYQGFVQMIVDNSSLIELIAGEKQVLIESGESLPDSDNVRFRNSPENDFFYSYRKRKQKNLQQQDWLTAGQKLYMDNEKIVKEIEKELFNVKEDENNMQKEIAESSLYAARFIEIMNFAEDLFQAEHKQNPEKIHYVKDYLQNKMDWKVLYTSGQFWTMVHNYTLSMFNKENPNRPVEESQHIYAKFMYSIIAGQEEPIRSGMIKSVFRECSAFGWKIAEEEILSYCLFPDSKENN